MRQLDIFGRDVMLKIDKRLARTTLRLRHLPEFAGGYVIRPIARTTANGFLIRTEQIARHESLPIFVISWPTALVAHEVNDRRPTAGDCQ